MKKITALLALFLVKIQDHHIQIFMVSLTLVLLILGAGAPMDVGGIGNISIFGK